MGKKMVLLERFSFCRRLSAVVKNCFGIGSWKKQATERSTNERLNSLPDARNGFLQN
jgi:hypothetical protein